MRLMLKLKASTTDKAFFMHTIFNKEDRKLLLLTISPVQNLLLNK